MRARAAQTFAQDRGTGATPAEAANAGATEGAFITSDAIPWKPADPSKPGASAPQASN